MKKTVKSAAIILIAALLAGSLAACGGSAAETTAATTEETTTYESERNGYPVTVIESQLKPKATWAEDIAVFCAEDDPAQCQNEILFYGASNFAKWTTMKEDMSEYKVLNHAFGGCNDVELVYYANEALYPYNPSVVFFQTGSNDYAGLTGMTDDEKLAACMDVKQQMFDKFHEMLPDAVFVVMSGLLLPGRSQYLELTQEVNEALKEMADNCDYIYYVDASAMTWDGTNFAEDLFVEDGIHLNDEGRAIWYRDYIKPAIEQVITERGLDYLRNE